MWNDSMVHLQIYRGFIDSLCMRQSNAGANVTETRQFLSRCVEDHGFAGQSCRAIQCMSDSSLTPAIVER